MLSLGKLVGGRNKYPVYGGDDLGVTLRKDYGIFKVWAPSAGEVRLRLFKQGDSTECRKEVLMERGLRGIWKTMIRGNIAGWYYTYLVTVDGVSREAVDPYARSVGVNGERGMVLDLLTTNPDGWQKHRRPEPLGLGESIIYEVHVRDFSIHESGHFKYAGKYLAFTEGGLKNSAGMPIGIDYLKGMGVTHVQLMPVADYCSVDERDSKDGYNWGYDPLNYNAPEGSYATDAYDGAVRVLELKSAIMALHEAGLRVILDVVYNHTGQTNDSGFSKLVPGYYYRKDADGFPCNGSGCGNEIATEQPMMTKFIMDSLKYWVNEYRVDGFRFDLMGIFDIDLVERIRKELPEVLIYGEGWSAGDCGLDSSKRALKENAASFGADVAFFSDDFRDGVRGSVWDSGDRGFISGNGEWLESLKMGIAGGAKHKQINYSKCKISKRPWAVASTQSINYCECHDNLTLWDKLSLCDSENSENERILKAKMAAALLFTAKGVPFIHAGQEFLRSKCDSDGTPIDNSYNFPDSVNAIDWERLSKYSNIAEYYRMLIAFRKKCRVLGDSRAKLVFYSGDRLVFSLSTDRETVCVAINNSKNRVTVNFPKGKWVEVNCGRKFKGSCKQLEPLSTMILYRKNYGKLKRSLAITSATILAGSLASYIVQKHNNSNNK